MTIEGSVLLKQHGVGFEVSCQPGESTLIAVGNAVVEVSDYGLGPDKPIAGQVVIEGIGAKEQILRNGEVNQKLNFGGENIEFRLQHNT